jgi:hypothetical protein
MDSLPIWAIWSTIPGVVVLAPVLAFLLATATVIIIGLLKEVAVPAVLAFTAAGISGWKYPGKRTGWPVASAAGWCQNRKVLITLGESDGWRSSAAIIDRYSLRHFWAHTYPWTAPPSLNS